MWYRVFSPAADPVSPAALAAHLHAAGHPVEPHFKGDDLGWTSGELRQPGVTVLVERYLTAEDDLRTELNAFAAELEAGDAGPAVPTLMRHVIQTQQLVTLTRPGADGVPDTVLTEACRFLAAQTDGVFQIDGRGWFAADGSLLVPEG